MLNVVLGVLVQSLFVKR